MVKTYKVVAKKLFVGDRKGETVYTIRPVSFGTLNTDDVARQIAAESTASPGDVKAVLDRYAYYVKENLKKGYNIELLDFGTLYLRFVKKKAVAEEKKANASLVKTLMPAFRPSFTKLANGTRLYDLTPDKIELVNYDELVKESGDASGSTSDSGSSDTGGSTSSDGSSTGGDSSNTGGSSDSGSSGDSGSANL